MKKSQKGVHLPDYSTTYIKDGKIQHGISRAGIKSREAANPSSFEEYDESPKAAKAIHGRVLGEIKQMPKPNLPKSEDGMEKGLKGDWQKENSYEFNIDEDEAYDSINKVPYQRLIVRAEHYPTETTSNDIGYAAFRHTPDGLVPDEVSVHKDHRRKGIANEMYRLAEEHSGLQIQRSDRQSRDAKALWSQPNRPFGKSEGAIKKGAAQKLAMDSEMNKPAKANVFGSKEASKSKLNLPITKIPLTPKWEERVKLPKSEDGMEKDDMPHEAGSPEDSAHDVVEEHSSLQEELADLTPEEQSEMLTHLRMLKDKRQLRSPENQEVGMDKAGDKETPPTHIEGVHKPLVDKEGQYYSTDKGRSSAGSKAIMGTSYKRGQVYHGSTMNPVKGEMAQKLSDKNIGEAKQQHHSVLSEMKQMPKPNLPKSEMEKSEYSANEVAIEILKKAESMYKAKAEEWDDHKTDKRIEDLPMAQTREVLNENDIVNAVSQKLTDNSVQRLKQYLEAKKAKKEKK